MFWSANATYLTISYEFNLSIYSNDLFWCVSKLASILISSLTSCAFWLSNSCSIFRWCWNGACRSSKLLCSVRGLLPLLVFIWIFRSASTIHFNGAVRKFLQIGLWCTMGFFRSSSPVLGIGCLCRPHVHLWREYLLCWLRLLYLSYLNKITYWRYNVCWGLCFDQDADELINLNLFLFVLLWNGRITRPYCGHGDICTSSQYSNWWQVFMYYLAFSG